MIAMDGPGVHDYTFSEGVSFVVECESQKEIDYYWNRLNLPERWIYLGFRLALLGTFANFLAVLIAAITGSGKLMPIAGGKEGTPVIEGIISFFLITLSIAMLAVCLILLAGLYKPLRSGANAS